MLALMLGSRLCSGRKSSRVLIVEVFVVRFFEDFKKADGFGGVYLRPVVGFGSLNESGFLTHAKRMH